MNPIDIISSVQFVVSDYGGVSEWDLWAFYYAQSADPDPLVACQHVLSARNAGEYQRSVIVHLVTFPQQPRPSKRPACPAATWRSLSSIHPPPSRGTGRSWLNTSRHSDFGWRCKESKQKTKQMWLNKMPIIIPQNILENWIPNSEKRSQIKKMELIK